MWTAISQAVEVATPAVTGGGGSVVAPFMDFVIFLKTAGPTGLAVLAGWWGFRKDREKNEVQEKATAAAKASYDQMVTLVGAQTAAMVKMEATIAALTSVIQRMDDRDREKP
jgi:hypothetical protein